MGIICFGAQLSVDPSQGTGGELVIQSGNWRVKRDTVWELEGFHVIQTGNWRVARDTVWELKGCT